MKFSGEKLRHEREELGMTQDELSHVAHVSVRSIRRYELDERVPDLNIAKRLAVALFVDLDELLRSEA